MLSPASRTRAYAAVPMFSSLISSSCSRRSDIENERLPPDLVDAESEEARELLSHPTTPAEGSTDGPSAERLSDRLSEVASGGSSISSPATPGSPATPTSPGLPSLGPFRGGHRRQTSLGTTKTSPSTRRRSLESTISMIKEAVDGGSDQEREDLEKIADSIVGAPAPSR
jgi:serine/threonine-protein phosphatase 2B catalytic subunit